MSSRPALWVATGTALVLAAGGGVSYALVNRGSSAVAAPSTQHPAVASSSSTNSSAPPPAALRITAISPVAGSSGVAATTPIVVHFSKPPAAGVTPTLTPAVAGSWTVTDAQTLTFTPQAAAVPQSREIVTVPAGTKAADGGVLAAAVSASWQVQSGNTERLQQLLAETGYLPVSFAPAAAEPATVAGLTDSAYAPVAGSFANRWATMPASLTGMWSPGAAPTLTRGAVLAFESVHGLATDGSPGPAVWGALIKDVAAGARDPRPYTYIFVTKHVPETLQLWSDGKMTYSTPANTGVSAAQTPDGSWPVYYRLRTQTMTGINPDGTHYSDPGVLWISYFLGGDAVHGFPRKSYGSPQSVGCVELPIANAAVVWNAIGYGTVVTISG